MQSMKLFMEDTVERLCRVTRAHIFEAFISLTSKIRLCVLLRRQELISSNTQAFLYKHILKHLDLGEVNDMTL